MMKKNLLLVITLLLSQFLIPTNAQAASTYKLQITVNELAAVGNVARFNGATVQQVCGAPNYLYMTPSFQEIPAKVSTATRVRVKNESGKIIGTGSLSTIIWVTKYSSGNLIQGSCQFSGKITVKSAQFYSVELIGVGTVDYSLADLKSSKWKIQMTI